jgi:hypothetical protein
MIDRFYRDFQEKYIIFYEELCMAVDDNNQNGTESTFSLTETKFQRVLNIQKCNLEPEI